MALQTTTLKARTADPAVKNMLFFDLSGTGDGPFVPARVDVDGSGAVGAPIAGAAMPSGGAGMTGWLSAIWASLAGTLSVSAASLPLPAGAATAAKQDAQQAALLAALGSPLQAGGTVNDAQSAPFQGAVAMTVGVTYAAQRSVGVICTITGNVQMTLADGSSITLPVTPGWQTFPFAVTQIVSAGTTATATFYNLK